MSVKVLFKNNYSKNVKLLVVLLDDSLKLYGDILAIDKKNKGLVSRIIKNKSFSAKNKEKLSLIGLNIPNIEEVILYGIGSFSSIKDDGIERIGGNIYSIIPPKVKNIARIPRANPKSPTRFTKKALIAAALAFGRVYQNQIKR